MKRLTVLISALTVFAGTPVFGVWVPGGQWGSPGWAYGEFNGIWDVAVAPNGNVYVSDHENHRIQYFTATGSFLGRIGSRGLENAHDLPAFRINHVDIVLDPVADPEVFSIVGEAPA